MTFKALGVVIVWVVCIAIAIALMLLAGDAKKSIESENSDEGRDV